MSDDDVNETCCHVDHVLVNKSNRITPSSLESNKSNDLLLDSLTFISFLLTLVAATLRILPNASFDMTSRLSSSSKLLLLSLDGILIGNDGNSTLLQCASVSIDINNDMVNASSSNVALSPSVLHRCWHALIKILQKYSSYNNYEY